MTQEEFEDLQGRVFRDIEAAKNTPRRQLLPRRLATITKESQRAGILPPRQQQAAVPTVTSISGCGLVLHNFQFHQ